MNKCSFTALYEFVSHTKKKDLIKETKAGRSDIKSLLLFCKNVEVAVVLAVNFKVSLLCGYIETNI